MIKIESDQSLGMKHFGLVYIFFAVVWGACAPYQYGPFNSEEEIREAFPPILKFMDYKAGMTFADVGASSGAITIMMATLMDNSLIYIQDIDTTKLKSKNIDKIITYYSRQCNADLRRKNKFQIIIGDEKHSNLPDESVDLIYTNATFHEFDYPDSMLVDLRRKLKQNGRIFIRDGFKNGRGVANQRLEKSCGKILKTIDEFLTIMKRNGFVLIKESENMDGYPLFGFKIEHQIVSDNSKRK
jgi:ubiquinone/menaquinone biosynthesis C-methylase UbiE